MKNHIIITGTRSCGTTFLVHLLTQLGLDTGFTEASSTILPNCNAGMEWDIRHAEAPYIVKSPFLCSQIDEIMMRGDISIEHVFVPIRDLFSAAESRRDGEHRTAPAPGITPGGVWGVERAEDMEAFLAQEFHALFVALAKWDIPHTLLSFPRTVNDPAYLYAKLKHLLGDREYSDFLEVFTAVAKPQLVHAFVPRLETGRFCAKADSAQAPVSPKILPQPRAANPLWNLFSTHEGPLIHKWHHYFDIYHQHFARYRNTNVRVLEFGISHGGSLQMWRDYFGPLARIIGVDINPECLMHATGSVEVFIGDQEDRTFLQELRNKVGEVDIIIEDGGHTMAQQLATFEVMFDAVAPDGVYLTEDLHTSYWSEYGGGWEAPGTFIEFSKTLIDRLNAWHSRDSGLGADTFTKAVSGMHFYDSVLVIEKMPNPTAPVHSMHGYPTLPNA
ncbi:hypothetical protein BH11VER1_BH11VER1_26480 [soil metagenome]